ncbi:MAG: cysteine-rich CWC family protein [Prevotellaceae bacterium]|jgi:hypothetical protein|nr:cysteine-rich CWC family protein [Prevotellaceae bacterium]
MNKICPSCNSLFDCRHDDIANCHCAGVALDAQQLAFIRENYAGCLCNTCLQAIKNNFYTFEVNPVYRKKNRTV